MAVARSELGSPGRQALRMFLRNRAAVFGLVLLSGIVLMTLCLLYTSPSPRDLSTSRMPSSA